MPLWPVLMTALSASTTLTPLLGTFSNGADILEISETHGALTVSAQINDATLLEPHSAQRFVSPTGRVYQFIGDGQAPPQLLLVDGKVFNRRDIGAEIQAKLRAWFHQKDLAVMMQNAQAATPTQAPDAHQGADLVDLATLSPTIKVHLAYAQQDNFAQVVFYAPDARAYVQRPVAQALARVAEALRPRGYGMRIYDAYRPWFITKIFWDAMPAEGKPYVADPAKGSRHNRGAAVDLTLYDLATGQDVIMPSAFDDPSFRSFAHAQAGTTAQRAARDVLRRAMEAEGFSVYPEEWWHFDFTAWHHYPIMNITPDKDAPAQAMTLYPGKLYPGAP